MPSTDDRGARIAALLLFTAYHATRVVAYVICRVLGGTR